MSALRRGDDILFGAKARQHDRRDATAEECRLAREFVDQQPGFSEKAGDRIDLSLVAASAGVDSALRLDLEARSEPGTDVIRGRAPQ